MSLSPVCEGGLYVNIQKKTKSHKFFVFTNICIFVYINQTKMSDYQKNQLSIIRQSQIKFVLDYCKMIGVSLTLKEMIGVTNVLVEYCENGYNKEVSDRLSKIDDYLQKKFDV